MKRMFQLLLITLLASAGSRAQAQDYKFWFARDGVNFYYTASSGTDEHVKLKVENRNSYKVEIRFQYCWTSGGREVKCEAGQMFDLGAGREQHGDYAGLWYYAPNGYSVSDLTFRLKDIRIKPE